MVQAIYSDYNYVIFHVRQAYRVVAYDPYFLTTVSLTKSLAITGILTCKGSFVLSELTPRQQSCAVASRCYGESIFALSI